MGNSTIILLLGAFQKNSNSHCNLQKRYSFQYEDLFIHIRVTREWSFTSIPTTCCNNDNFSFNVFKQDQQDVLLHNGIYYCKYSTCFTRFLRPSSEAQNCISGICRAFSASCSNSLMIAVRSRKSSRNTRCCVYSFELLMVGRGTVWNM